MGRFAWLVWPYEKRKMSLQSEMSQLSFNDKLTAQLALELAAQKNTE